MCGTTSASTSAWKTCLNQLYYLPLGGAYLGEGATMSFNREAWQCHLPRGLPPGTASSWSTSVAGPGRTLLCGHENRFLIEDIPGGFSRRARVPLTAARPRPRRRRPAALIQAPPKTAMRAGGAADRSSRSPGKGRTVYAGATFKFKSASGKVRSGFPTRRTLKHAKTRT